MTEPPQDDERGWLGRVVRDGLGRLGGRSSPPGSPEWWDELNADVRHCQNTARGHAEVVPRRKRRLARADDPLTRFAETFALATIDAWTCSPQAAKTWLEQAFASGPIPEGFVHRGGELVRLMIKWHVATDAVPGWIDRLLEVATTERLSLLNILAWFHGTQYAFAKSAEVSRLALLEMGWLDTSDPFRNRMRAASTFEEHERAPLSHLVGRLAYAEAWLGDFDEARTLLTALAQTLGGGIRPDERETLTFAQAGVDCLQGRFTRAKQAYREVLHNLEGLGLGETPEAMPALASLASTFLRLGLVNKASVAAKQALKLSALDPWSYWQSRDLAYYVRAEAARRKRHRGRARRMAERMVDGAVDPIVSAGALRILAELELADGKREPARALALQGVDRAHAIVGEHRSLALDLLTLARTQDPDDARATLRRALALPLPPKHPTRAEIHEAAAAHGMAPQ